MDEESNKNEQNTTPNELAPVLNDKEMTAIQMKFLGRSSTEISAATGYNENYVRNLFMTGGRLERHYVDFARLQRAKSQQKIAQVIDRAREEALPAIETIIALSRAGDTEAAQYNASKLLLQMAGIQSETSLRNFFADKDYDQAKEMLEKLFQDLYGRSVQGKQIIVYHYCRKCDPQKHREEAAKHNDIG